MSEEQPPAVLEEKAVETTVVEKETNKEEKESTGSDWLSAGTSWGSSWLQTAKQKTFQTLELVKKDLDEFKDVMTQEVNEMTTAAKEGLGTVGAQVKQQAQYLEKLVTPEEEENKEIGEGTKKSEETEKTKEEEEKTKVSQSNSMGFGWMKSLVDTVKQLAVEDTTEGEDAITEAIKPKFLRRTNLPMDKLQAVQSCDDTYLQEPDPIVFDDWMKKFSMDEHDGEINMLLSNTPALRQIYAKLVPSVIDNSTFWSRYFFKVELAEIDEEMKFTRNELTINTELKQKMEKTVEKNGEDSTPSSDSPQRCEPHSGPRSNDSWSVCGKEEHEIEELASTDGGEDTEVEESEEKEESVESEEKKESVENTESGPLTPRPNEDKAEKTKGEKEDGWVDWDE